MMFMVLTAAFLSVGQGSKPAGDFAFRLEYGLCTTDVLDTFQGVFVRDLGSRVASIPLALSRESLDAAFQAIATAHFFDYPSSVWTKPTSDCIVTPNTGGGSTVTCSAIGAASPASHYKLTVQNAGVTHTVSWWDNAPSTEPTNRLRTMFNNIVELIRGMPQVRRLPLPQALCG
jgi:hypothetical protein